jgi:hypothetical protein
VLGSTGDPLLGFALIFLNLSPILVNAIGSLVFALLIPYVAIGRTLLYFDLGVRKKEAVKAPWWQRHLPRSRPAETS